MMKTKIILLMRPTKIWEIELNDSEFNRMVPHQETLTNRCVRRRICLTAKKALLNSMRKVEIWKSLQQMKWISISCVVIKLHKKQLTFHSASLYDRIKNVPYETIAYLRRRFVGRRLGVIHRKHQAKPTVWTTLCWKVGLPCPEITNSIRAIICSKQHKRSSNLLLIRIHPLSCLRLLPQRWMPLETNVWVKNLWYQAHLTHWTIDTALLSWISSYEVQPAWVAQGEITCIILLVKLL